MTINGYIYLALAIVIVMLTAAVSVEYAIISSLKTDKAELEQTVKDMNQLNAGLTRDRDNCTAEKRTFESELQRSRAECEDDKWKWIDKEKKEIAARYAAELGRCRSSWEKCEKQLVSGGTGHEECDAFIIRSITDYYYPGVHP